MKSIKVTTVAIITSKFLDPKNDVAFKKVFGTELQQRHFDPLVNDILDFKGENEIHGVKFLSPIQNSEIIDQKQSIVDVYCRNRKGRRFIVEIYKKNIQP